MDNYDIKVAKKALYRPARQWHEVDVPAQNYLMADGHGDPNTTPAYTQAIETLYRASYGARKTAKHELGRVHTVGPLEALWWADDPADFTNRVKDNWHWTLMIAQPDWITASMIEGEVRFETLIEGRSVQILHVGPYDDEGPTLTKLHDEYMPENGLTFNGHHHEIYLSDARRTEPARSRTVLRQPVIAAVMRDNP